VDPLIKSQLLYQLSYEDLAGKIPDSKYKYLQASTVVILRLVPWHKKTGPITGPVPASYLQLLLNSYCPNLISPTLVGWPSVTFTLSFAVFLYGGFASIIIL
jgi:hypothetical protein